MLWLEAAALDTAELYQGQPIQRALVRWKHPALWDCVQTLFQPEQTQQPTAYCPRIQEPCRHLGSGPPALCDAG